MFKRRLGVVCSELCFSKAPRAALVDERRSLE